LQRRDLVAAEIEALARAWMLHQGYTDEQVDAIATSHSAYGCERENDGWNCRDEEDNSLHPDWDELVVACEMANVAIVALRSSRLQKKAKSSPHCLICARKNCYHMGNRLT
jgi:hypothetical protein